VSPKGGAHYIYYKSVLIKKDITNTIPNKINIHKTIFMYNNDTPIIKKIFILFSL